MARMPWQMPGHKNNSLEKNAAAGNAAAAYASSLSRFFGFFTVFQRGTSRSD